MSLKITIRIACLVLASLMMPALVTARFQDGAESEVRTAFAQFADAYQKKDFNRLMAMLTPELARKSTVKPAVQATVDDPRGITGILIVRIELNAEKATNAADRLAWQRLAEDWTSLARGAEINPCLSASTAQQSN